MSSIQGLGLPMLGLQTTLVSLRARILGSPLGQATV